MVFVVLGVSTVFVVLAVFVVFVVLGFFVIFVLLGGSGFQNFCGFLGFGHVEQFSNCRIK